MNYHYGMNKEKLKSDIFHLKNVLTNLSLKVNVIDREEYVKLVDKGTKLIKEIETNLNE